METNSKNLDDLIFENRNKAYGAYANRKNYDRYMFWALTSAIALFLTVVSAPLIANYFNPGPIAIDDPNNVTINLANVPDHTKDIKIPEAQKTQKVERVYNRFIATMDENEVVDFMDIMEMVKNRNVTDTVGYTDNFEPVDDPQIIERDEPKTFTVVEEMPEFPGGEIARLKYLSENIRYPQVAKETGIEGIVYVQFVVDETGKVVDLVLLRGIGGGCDEEALRVVSQMPDWKPGRQTGQAVRVQFSLPISFKLK